MCTLSFIRIGNGIRLVHSRDEQRDRAEGIQPTPFEEGPFTLIAPRDPDAGGTWIAARDDGVILAVMNRNPEPPPELDKARLRSRGLLVGLLASLPADELPEALRSIDTGRYAPFRAFAAIPGGEASHPVVWAAHWDPTAPSDLPRASVARHNLPICWASSGLGDSVVTDRLPLFRETVSTHATPDAQDAFHRHSWPDRGAASVLMSRRDARTVSITTAETNPDDPKHIARMTYLSLEPGPSIEDPMTLAPAHFTTLEPRNLASRG